MARKMPPEHERRKVVESMFKLMRTECNSSSSACKKLGYPHSTVNRWMEDLGLVEDYTRARNDMHERIADELMEITDQDPPLTPMGTIDNAGVQDKRLRVDTRKWLLSKIYSKKYGDKIDHTSSDGSMSMANAILQAKKILDKEE